MYTYDKFIATIWEVVYTYPKNWRQGQKVFNACEELFGSIARDVQFKDKIDCFYDDSKIDEFIAAVWERLENDNN